MLKKITAIIFLLWLFISNSYAHPLDISTSTFNFKENKIEITTYFHSFEIDYLLKQNNINIDSIEEYFLNEDIIKKYIKDNIEIKNDNDKCEINNINLNKSEIYNILVEGLEVSYDFQCIDDINDLYLKIDYFTNFPLQTNKISFVNKNISNKGFLNVTLTAKINNLTLKKENDYKTEHGKDSDCDGLSDKKEKIYGTDPNNIDTDGDNYTDYEEIKFGWPPLNYNNGPGQTNKDKITNIECPTQKVKSEIIDINKDQEPNKGIYSSKILKTTLKYISDFFNKNEGNILYIFLLVYILGIIHAFGPGHSKSILVAYTLDSKVGYRKGYIYALIFSITHILDILLLYLITTIAFKYIDISKYGYYIQVTSAVLLILFSLYLIYKSFFKKDKSSCTKKENIYYIAFLSGLAPCTFAWAIYFLLLSIGYSQMLLPLIFALGLGIFTTLFIIVTMAILIKNKTLMKTKLFTMYASKISALLIFIASVIIAVSLINL